MAHKNALQEKAQIPAKASVSVVGARGYTGLELIRLLLNHSGVRLTHCYATQGFRLTDEILDSRAASVVCLEQCALLDNLTDVVFLATPAEVSLELAPKIVAQGKMVIDLSGALRLKKHDMGQWYGMPSAGHGFLSTCDYGLVPFCGPLKKSTRAIANPGCYATAIAMALLPLLKHDLIETTGLVIDAKSGTTGAGRKAGENLLFSEVAGECLPYRVGKHQHLPEIQETAEQFAGVSIDPHFATHLLPVRRGIVASLYATAKTTDVQVIQRAFDQEYAGYPLVRHGTKISQLARLQHVVGTPFTHLSYELTGNKLYLFSVLDNLLKGAASQAVENLNRCLDLPITTALGAEA